MLLKRSYQKRNWLDRSLCNGNNFHFGFSLKLNFFSIFQIKIYYSKYFLSKLFSILNIFILIKNGSNIYFWIFSSPAYYNFSQINRFIWIQINYFFPSTLDGGAN